MDIKDNIITKYLRPGTLIWTIIVFTFLVIFDSWMPTFNVKDSYIDVFSLLFAAEIGFYFTSRGAEKIASMNFKHSRRRYRDDDDDFDDDDDYQDYGRRRYRDDDDDFDNEIYDIVEEIIQKINRTQNTDIDFNRDVKRILEDIIEERNSDG